LEFGFKQDVVVGFELGFEIKLFGIGYENHKSVHLSKMQKTQSKTRRSTAMIQMCKYYIKTI